MPAKSPLTVLFDTQGGEIIDSWTQALHNLSGTHFAGLPLAELEEGCREALAAYRALIEARDQHLLRQLTAGLVRRAAEGFSLHEIQRALLLLKAIVRPRLLAHYAHAPDLASFSADWQRLEHAVDIGLIRLS